MHNFNQLYNKFVIQWDFYVMYIYVYLHLFISWFMAIIYTLNVIFSSWVAWVIWRSLYCLLTRGLMILFKAFLVLSKVIFCIYTFVSFSFPNVWCGYVLAFRVPLGCLVKGRSVSLCDLMFVTLFGASRYLLELFLI